MRNVAGALVDVVRDQADKYPAPAVSVSTSKTPAHRKVVRAKAIEEELEDLRSPAEQLDDAVLTLQFLLKDRLTTSEYAALRSRWELGVVDPNAAILLITRAKREDALDAAVFELKAFIAF